MQVTTIFDHEFPNLQSLKDFAKLHNIVPVGNKTFKATWIEAIEAYMDVQSEVVAMALAADIESSKIAVEVETAAVSIGSLVVAALTSETAVLAYRVILKSVAFVLVIAWLVSASAIKWCWAHRSHTAVYHWVKDAIDSATVRSVLTHVLINRWVLKEWRDPARSIGVSTVTACRVWADGIVGEIRSVVG